jgi:organic hydroperoxide reductase OsmC/OhrA
MKTHTYQVGVQWTGNDGTGTMTYRGYRRDHTIMCLGKPALAGSSDAAFRGNPTRHSPEDLLVASLSACHMLWYLHVCATNHVNVLSYRDEAAGRMEESADGSGAFAGVTLRPAVTIAATSDASKAHALHAEAHRFCFIARSVNFVVAIEPDIVIAPP